MDVIKPITGTVTGAVRGAWGAARHPIATGSYALGLTRGIARAVVGALQDTAGPTHASSVVPTPEQPTTAEAPAEAPPDLDEVADVESSWRPDPGAATEPKAASRQSAHGGPVAPVEAEELDEPDIDADVITPAGTTGVAPGENPDTGTTDLQQPGTEPLMDPSTTKAVRSEAETLRKAAEQDKG